MSGNSTFLIGVTDAEIEHAMKIISQNCKKREQVLPSSIAGDPSVLAREMTKVIVGGATVFVLNVEEFKHL